MVKILTALLCVSLLAACGAPQAAAPTAAPPTAAPPPTEAATATSAPTEEPTEAATAEPTATTAPTEAATAEPTATSAPTEEPTEAATAEPTATSAPTEEPTEAATAEPTAAPATEVPPTATTAPADTNGDLVARGLQVYQSSGCIGCHALSAAGASGTVGPPHDGLGATAAQRIQESGYTGQATDAAGYIRESIVNPSAYIVPGFEAVPMPSFATLSPGDLDALVAMLSQQ